MKLLNTNLASKCKVANANQCILTRVCIGNSSNLPKLQKMRSEWELVSTIVSSIKLLLHDTCYSST